MTFFVNCECVFVALPREGSGRVWRHEEVPAFPPEPSLPHPRAAANTTLVYQKKSLDLFGLSLMVITVLHTVRCR